MLWLLLLHISAVVCWCGSLLYLPALIAGTASQQTDIERERQQSLMLMVYRLFSTPAALIAIASGTALFITGGITGLWLILKLSLVSTLVFCHALSGWMMLLTQKMPDKNVTLSCVLLIIVVAILIPSIVWVVLTKPL
ncbi:CopD family protein [Methylobacter svalbardensis]|uniref:CopD family protein n=1 Tax=Methylobacter svalbardensis TaxID=3080016 RepID=UPI0030EC2E82